MNSAKNMLYRILLSLPIAAILAACDGQSGDKNITQPNPTVTDPSPVYAKVIFPPTKANFMQTLDKVTVRGRLEGENGIEIDPSDIEKFSVGGLTPEISGSTWKVELELQEDTVFDIQLESKEGFVHNSSIELFNTNKSTAPEHMVYDPIKNRIYVFDDGRKIILSIDLTTNKVTTLAGRPSLWKADRTKAFFVTKDGNSLVLVNRFSDENMILQIDTETGEVEKLHNKPHETHDITQAHHAAYNPQNNSVLLIVNRRRIAEFNLETQEIEIRYTLENPTPNLPEIKNFHGTTLNLRSSPSPIENKYYSRLYISENADSFYTALQIYSQEGVTLDIYFVEINLKTQTLRYITSKNEIERAGFGKISPARFTYHQASRHFYFVSESEDASANIIKVSTDGSGAISKLLSLNKIIDDNSDDLFKFLPDTEGSKLYYFDKSLASVSTIDVDTNSQESFYSPPLIAALPEKRGLSYNVKHRRIESASEELHHYYLNSGEYKTLPSPSENGVFSSPTLLADDSYAIITDKQYKMLSDDFNNWGLPIEDHSISLVNLATQQSTPIIPFSNIHAHNYYQYRIVSIDEKENRMLGYANERVYVYNPNTGKDALTNVKYHFTADLSESSQVTPQIKPELTKIDLNSGEPLDYQNNRQFGLFKNDDDETYRIMATDIFDKSQTIISMAGVKGEGPAVGGWLKYYDESSNTLYSSTRNHIYRLPYLLINTESGDRAHYCKESEQRSVTDISFFNVFGADTDNKLVFSYADFFDGILVTDLETCTTAFLLD